MIVELLTIAAALVFALYAFRRRKMRNRTLLGMTGRDPDVYRDMTVIVCEMPWSEEYLKRRAELKTRLNGSGRPRKR